MIETMDTSKVELWEQAFLDAFLGIEGVDHAEDHRPERIEPNTVCLMFDDEVPGDQATSRVERVEFQWIVQIYVHGYERRDMQKTMQRIIMGLRRKFRQDPTLGRVLKKRPRFDSLGPFRVLRLEGGPALVKSYRLGVEREVR